MHTHTHSTHSTVVTRQVFLGSSMRFGVVGFRPLHLVSAFILLRTFFSSFIFMSFCLHVLASHPFSLCAHIGPALTAHARSYTKPRFEVAQVVVMRSGSFGCSWSLGSLSSRPHTPGLSCPPFMSSFVCLVCAHARTLVVAFVLFASPIGRRVCETLGILGLPSKMFPYLAGGTETDFLSVPTKLRRVGMPTLVPAL